MKRYKIRGLFFVLLGVILALGVVSGATSCNDGNQIIFRIESDKNAHGEIWNGDNNYVEEICFDNYFAGPGSGDRGDGAGLVLRLSADTNAEARDPGMEQGNYPVEVRYGDLTCALRSSLCGDYDVGGRRGSFIVSLSGNTEAHLALSSGPYDWNLCCVSASEQPICNYDDDCDDSDGENPINCPADCVGVGGFCGDDERNGNEECDGDDYGEFDGTCENYDSGLYESGNLTCVDCEIEFEMCVESEDANFCEEYNNPFYYDDEENCPPGGCIATSCDDINKLDLPSDFPGGNLDEFRMAACEAGCGVADIDSSAPDDAINKRCVWDSDAEPDNRCQLAYDVVGGSSCIIEVIEESQCSEDGTHRTITIRVREEGQDGPGQCDACGGEPTCQKDVPCARVVRLPFFGMFSFVLSVAIISLVYFFYLQKRK